ncbi:ubiquitin carboxyl-terminal hydrolase 37-like [Gouania willdenowi]|uniref:ubiquitin carboxyl-terminal hydrolase 37-like n=1 Tax=Gouania willdenowi TaxID=441366 RepID=UPI001054B027|nr:ubiquitin carboxyl-terminal hydrolase 37-like [Gouania willdenowi]
MKESSVVLSNPGDDNEDTEATVAYTEPELIDRQSETKTLQMEITDVENCLTDVLVTTTEFQHHHYQRQRRNSVDFRGTDYNIVLTENLGLPNLTNTCYINATLQALLTLKGFIDDIYRQKVVWEKHFYSVGFKELLSIRHCQFQLDNEKRCSLRRFKDNFVMSFQDFDNDDQMDAPEFMLKWLYRLRESKDDFEIIASNLSICYLCPVDAQFSFDMVQTITCLRCGSKSSIVENFIIMTQTVKANTSLDKCLLDGLTEETVQRLCDCGFKESSQKHFFQSLPNVLVVQLTRFLFRNDKAVKDSGAVDFSQILEIPAKFCVNERKSVKYSLVSVVSHVGTSTKYGHYICDGVNSKQSQSSKSWLTYSDNNVKETSIQDVIKDRKSSAYLLFFERQNSPLILKSKSV